MAKSTVPYVTRSDVVEYLEREQQRLELQRKANALERQNRPLKEKLLAYVQAAGGKARSVVRSGYRLSIHVSPGYPRWKDEFVRVAGPAAAERLIAEAPPRESLAVDPA